MKKIIEKKVGETPLETLERFRSEDASLKYTPLTYSGRLDPMASGKMLILTGEDCKKREDFDKLDKEYEFGLLIGVKSDSGDALGMVEECEGYKNFSENEIATALKSFIGEYKMEYPVYSSKTVAGKPLFHHARLNNLRNIKIPTVSGKIYELAFINKREISRQELIESAIAKISLLKTNKEDKRVGSGFRKEEIIARWQDLKKMGDKNFLILKIKAVVSAGTYIKALAPLIAEKLGSCGLAFSIHRTKIGRFQSELEKPYFKNVEM